MGRERTQIQQRLRSERKGWLVGREGSETLDLPAEGVTFTEMEGNTKDWLRREEAMFDLDRPIWDNGERPGGRIQGTARNTRLEFQPELLTKDEHGWTSPGGLGVKNPPANAGGHRFDPWSGKIPHAVTMKQFIGITEPVRPRVCATRGATVTRRPCMATREEPLPPQPEEACEQ